ncbi:hypothetical protein BN1221_02503 [Brenneria goodwinii]|uniref:Uncharacterized protein n=1 Tax=Brenneria goodwinii TaxID=1109412 RepID=A0A0G4JWJ5_9GAMM|nr:hypothetical protein BN1221_02503 [Brenneria goodwinii]
MYSHTGGGLFSSFCGLRRPKISGIFATFIPSKAVTHIISPGLLHDAEDIYSWFHFEQNSFD